MIRRPPRSTLFPYRRSSDLEIPDTKRGTWPPPPGGFQSSDPWSLLGEGHTPGSGLAWHLLSDPKSGYAVIRSEEHTSELQSHLNLVCRLLLEKKKQI